MSISDDAASRREQYRNPIGQFGTQPGVNEPSGVCLSTPETSYDDTTVDTAANNALRAAFWTDADEINEDGKLSAYDFSDHACEQMTQDLKDFYAQAGPIIERTGMSADHVGHNFWLTRNHHGTGFWDRELGEDGDKLTDIAQSFGEVSLFVDDDGKFDYE